LTWRAATENTAIRKETSCLVSRKIPEQEFLVTHGGCNVCNWLEQVLNLLLKPMTDIWNNAESA